MRLRLALSTLIFLLSATAFGYDANWWYAKYQKLGDANPKWDALVREGMDHWVKGGEALSDVEARAEFDLAAEALEKAYAAGCRCPIALFMDGTSGCFPWLRLPESLALTEKKPELAFVRIFCANALGWKYDRAGQFKEAIPYFEMALSLSSPDVDEDAVQEDAKAGLQEAREEVAASGSWTTALRRS